MQHLSKFLTTKGIKLTEEELKDLMPYLELDGKGFCLEGRELPKSEICYQHRRSSEMISVLLKAYELPLSYLGLLSTS